MKVYDKKGKVVSNIIDPDKSVSNLYALDGGEKYTVEISSSAMSDSTYTLTVEQDNWVYAPEGGVKIHNTLHEYYFSETNVKRIIFERFIEKYDVNITDPNTFFNESSSQKVQYNRAEVFFEALAGDDYKEGVINTVNTAAAVLNLTVCIMCILNPASAVVACVNTISGYVLTFVGVSLNGIEMEKVREINDLKDAMILGNYNVVVSIEPGVRQTTMFRPWSTSHEIKFSINGNRYERVYSRLWNNDDNNNEMMINRYYFGDSFDLRADVQTFTWEDVILK